VYYPRSFLKFILLGFLLVSAPLVYAMAELILTLDRLASQGREEVLQAAQAGRVSRQLYEQATTLERIARQQIILDDASLLEEYGKLRQDFAQTAAQLALLPLEAAQQARLSELTAREAGLQKLLVSGQRTNESTRALVDGYAQLVADTQAMIGASTQLTQRAIERLQQTASEGRETWMYVGLASLGIAIALAILFAVLIARPVRQLDQAIRRMGTADFRHAIQLTGPEDLRYVGQRLEWLRTRLSELEEQKARFLRHVSHELKTPLTAVREGAELLRDNVGGRLTPEQHDIVRIVRDNTLSLQKLIEDLLAYQQTRAAEPATMEPVALADVVRRVAREQTLAAFARMIAFEGEMQPAMVIGDPERLRTIVDNLLSNAIKYSPRNGQVDLSLAARDGFAVLDVIDQGPGVAPVDRHRIFESFYQGPAPDDGRIKGSGLGLAIAREYAVAHGGRIEVLDRADGQRGAWFRLWLPLAARSGAIAREEAGTAPPRLASVK
jgi:two-component system, NtrC family, sensor histidine kinase GlrK